MCEEVFEAMRANTRKEDIKFSRRLGEKSSVARPLIIGLENEEQKRHVLFKARNLKRTRFEEVSIVPDLTRKQRKIEDKMRQEAEDRNKQLTKEDRDNNLRWIVVGKRGEKRLIKGIERQDRGQNRNLGLAGGNEWWGRNPRDQPHTIGQYIPAVPQPTASGNLRGGGHRGGGQPGGGHNQQMNNQNNQQYYDQRSNGHQPSYQQQNNYTSGNQNYSHQYNGQQGRQEYGGNGNGRMAVENWREGEQYQQENSQRSNIETNTFLETQRTRLPSNKRTREQDQEGDQEPARNRGRH